MEGLEIVLGYKESGQLRYIVRWKSQEFIKPFAIRHQRAEWSWENCGGIRTSLSTSLEYAYEVWINNRLRMDIESCLGLIEEHHLSSSRNFIPSHHLYRIIEAASNDDPVTQSALLLMV